MNFASALLLVNLSATWFMTGLIWFVQVVHYPLFVGVGAGAFAAYHRQHTRRTTAVVAPAMLVEAATAIALLVWIPPNVPGWVPWIGLLLLAIAWLSTAVLQVPQHNRLAIAFSQSTCGALCVGNWVRTAAWTARALLTTGALAVTPG